MKRIKTLNGPPKSFMDWLENNEKTIAKKIKNKAVSGADIWAYFRSSGLYNELKKVLIKDQGFICCYCGQRLSNDHRTAIKHLKPKSKVKRI